MLTRVMTRRPSLPSPSHRSITTTTTSTTITPSSLPTTSTKIPTPRRHSLSGPLSSMITPNGLVNSTVASSVITTSRRNMYSDSIYDEPIECIKDMLDRACGSINLDILPVIDSEYLDVKLFEGEEREVQGDDAAVRLAEGPKMTTKTYGWSWDYDSVNNSHE